MICEQEALSLIENYLREEGLPEAYAETARRWFLPLAEELRNLSARQEGMLVVGISGCQGSGKSTLGKLLVRLLEQDGSRAISLSLDDFYLERRRREVLAEHEHPLLLTRGVPGTHDVALARETIEALRREGEVRVPGFDKASDDRLPPEQWPRVRAPLDVLVLEGWCLGATPQAPEELVSPVNALERDEDPDGHWRRFVNDALAGCYQQWFADLDYLIMLKAPSFEKVYDWRRRQEEQLVASLGNEASDKRVMSSSELARFIQHYERLTRHALATLPERADVVLELDGEQGIAGRH